MRVTSLQYEDWVRLMFDHPGEGPEWHWEEDSPYWDGPPAATLDYLTRLFADPLPVLKDYSDAQLNRGLWYVLGASGANHPEVLAHPDLPVEARVRCLYAMTTLFRELFAVRCSPHLSHIDEPGAGVLNGACYMWWDIITFFAAPDSPERRPVDLAAMDVMRETLAIEHVACQENALHGLGHWCRYYPDVVKPIIDGFLDTHAHARPELLAYARSARDGCVL